MKQTIFPIFRALETFLVRNRFSDTFFFAISAENHGGRDKIR